MSLTREAKHGHEMLRAGGAVSKARVVCWDRNAPNSVIALVLSEDGDSEGIYLFKPDGTSAVGYTLRDAPAPKARGVDWIVRWRSEDGLRRHAALHYTKEAASAHARFLISKGRSHVSVSEVPWTEGMGLEAESSDD